MSQKNNRSGKEEMTAREKRIKEAVLMHYDKGKQVQEIAEEMDYDRKTIQRYLDSDFASNLKRVYSDRDLYDLKAQLESEIRESYKMANSLLAKAIEDKDATPRDMIKASKQAQEIRLDHIQMLKELGIITPKQEDESNKEDMEDLRKELVEGLKAKKEEINS